MKEFKVLIGYFEGGYTYVKALDEEDAEQKVDNILLDEGVGGLDFFEVTTREMDVYEVIHEKE